MFIETILKLAFVHWGNPRAGMPYDSQQGIPENVARVVVVICVLFLSYIVYRVRKAMKDPNYMTRMKSKKKNIKKLLGKR